MARPLPSGTPVGEYEIITRLGEGGMGEVYSAQHPHIGKRVAIKVMRRVAADALPEARRLLEEARAVNAIRHSGIIDIFGANVLPDGRPYLVMELLEGVTLAQHIETHSPLEFAEVFRLLEGILSPLIAAHRAGVIHRDLKTSNIFLVDTAEGRRVKLLDFGVARRDGRDEPLTGPQMTVGSLGFMGPEHLEGRVGPQSDLYAVGCIAWLLITGRPVFSYKNVALLARDHLHTVPPPVSSVRAYTPDELESWVAWLLEKDIDQRPFSADVALTTLKEAEHLALGEQTVSFEANFMRSAKAIDARARQMARPSERKTDLHQALSDVDTLRGEVPTLKTRPAPKPVQQPTRLSAPANVPRPKRLNAPVDKKTDLVDSPTIPPRRKP
jgi:serine/threonine protein kinase